MDRQKFIEYIEDPSKLHKEDQKFLVEVVKEFPYCQSAHMLLLKALHNQDSIHFNNQLKVTAAYAGSRKSLHKLIHANTLSSKPTSTPESQKNINLHVVKEENHVPIESEEKKDASEQEEIAQTIDNKEITPANTEIKKPVLHEDATSQETPSIDEIEDSSLEKSTKKVTSPNLPKLGKQEADKKQSFYAWLKETGMEDISDQKENELDNEEEQNLKGDLIDKFLQVNPRIVPVTSQRTEFFSAVDMAKKSLEEHDDIYTETLAEIFVKQEKYEKAKKAFSVLSLKNPEKSSYFAARLKELDEILNKKENE